MFKGAWQGHLPRQPSRGLESPICVAVPPRGWGRSLHSQPYLPAQRYAPQQRAPAKEAVDVSEDTKATSSEMVFKETHLCIAELAEFKARRQRLIT